MLETLEEIPWRDLNHAYGPAVDVPDLIRAVAFGDGEARARAWNELYGNLWHQGTVYEASSHAIPFLLEIAAKDTAPDLHDVIVYLTCLARGSSCLDVHQHLIYRSADAIPAEVEERLAQELEWVRQAREEARKGLPRYLSLLDHDDPLVRSASCHLLACFPEELATVRPRLRRRFDEGDKDAGARAACVLAIGDVSRTDGACPEEAKRALDGAEPPAVRAIAAIVVALFERADASNELRTFVAELAADLERFEAILRLFPWDAGNPEEYLVPALAAVGAGDGRPVELLADALRQSDPVGSQYCVEFLCAVAFQSAKAPDPPSLLSLHQRRALTEIERADAFWRWAAGSGRLMAADTLKGYNLPAEREELRAYLRNSMPP
jgi:hypothetical protein